MDEYARNEAIVRQRELVKKKNEAIYRDNSKKRLLTVLEKKFKTTMIGALARFEDTFGYLWGHGKDDVELTERELEFRKMWEDTRTEVLNNGNNQLRGAQDELAQYSMSWDKYKTEFIIRKPQ
jgi:hypothetical protein